MVNISDVMREIFSSISEISTNQRYAEIIIVAMIFIPLFRSTLNMADSHSTNVDKRLLITGIVVSLACAVLLLTNVLAGLSVIPFIIGMIGVMLITLAFRE